MKRSQRSAPLRRPTEWLIALAVAALLGCAPAQAQGERAKPKGGAADLEGDAQRQMAELEETMDRLARLLEIDEPENALRLREAYARAREKFLSENMGKVVDFLKSQKLEEAIGKHGEVAVNLEGLLGILTSGEVDEEALQGEIERLEAIKARLSELEKKERALKEGSDKLAAQGEPAEGQPGEGQPGEGQPGEGQPGEGQPGEGQPGEGQPGEEKPPSADEAKQEQDATKESTDKLAEEMEKGADGSKPTPGTAAAKSGAAAMGKASESLGSGQPGDAAPSQEEAADKLAEAREEVEKEIKALKNQLQSQALAELKSRFEEMLKEQQKLTTDTLAADERLRAAAAARKAEEEARELTRKDKLELTRLAKGEGGLGDQAEDSKRILEEEGTSVVFPEVLKMLVLYLVEARERLEEEETGRVTHEAQKEAEQILEEMIAALDKEMEFRKSKGCGT